MLDYQKDFIDYALARGVLKFGQFQLKSGRLSPYFFNTGLFNTGESLGKLGLYYAQALQQSGLSADILYGPAYKGIPLVSSTAIAYAQLTGQDMPFVFNRKEEKDHGEGGVLVGAPLQGNVVIVDDVISAGTSVNESMAIIAQTPAKVTGVLIALDRQEQGGQSRLSAIDELQARFALPVVAIITLANIIDYLTQYPDNSNSLASIKAYQARYGIGVK